MDKNSYTYNRDKDYRRNLTIIYIAYGVIILSSIIYSIYNTINSKIDTTEAIQLEIVSDTTTNIILKDPDSDQIYYANK